jgi:hypothetical protein
MSNGIGRFGVSGPPNATSPGGANTVTSSNTGAPKPFYQTGPFWVIIFLIVGWLGVYRTIR